MEDLTTQWSNKLAWQMKNLQTKAAKVHVDGAVAELATQRSRNT